MNKTSTNKSGIHLAYRQGHLFEVIGPEGQHVCSNDITLTFFAPEGNRSFGKFIK
jgi:hypothetical protein